MEETVTGRAISSGIRLGALTPGELCDLIFFWIQEGKEEAKAMKDKGMFEVPPPGYRGDLEGTSWAPDAMAASFSPTEVVAGAVS